VSDLSSINKPPPSVEQGQGTLPEKVPPGQISKEDAPGQAKKTQQTHATLLQGTHLNDPSQKPAQQFVDVMKTLIEEGYENYKVPQSDKGAGVFSDQKGQEYNEDMKFIRQFSRDLQQLVQDKGLSIRQALNRIKTEQGGQFWQRLQQILQKGMPLDRALMMQRNLKQPTGLEGKLSLVDKGGGLDGENLQNPGRAMLEMIQGEINPKGQMEHMLLALHLLVKDGMDKSSDKLLNYLRQRGGLSERELQYYLKQQGIVYWQGPMPRHERSKNLDSLWYALISLLVIPLSHLMGLGLGKAILLGMVVMMVVFLSTASRR